MHLVMFQKGKEARAGVIDGEDVIDINAWPSYARYRDRAAQAIADLLVERFERRLRLVDPIRN